MLQSRLSTTAPCPIASPIRVLDAAGGLTTEPFVNGHLHLCKVYTLDSLGDDALRRYHGNSMGGAMNAIEKAATVKAGYRVDRLLPEIDRALRRAIAYGTSHIRAFADTDTTAGFAGIDAVMHAHDAFRSFVIRGRNSSSGQPWKMVLTQLEAFRGSNSPMPTPATTSHA